MNPNNPGMPDCDMEAFVHFGRNLVVHCYVAMKGMKFCSVVLALPNPANQYFTAIKSNQGCRVSFLNKPGTLTSENEIGPDEIVDCWKLRSQMLTRTRKWLDMSPI